MQYFSTLKCGLNNLTMVWSWARKFCLFGGDGRIFSHAITLEKDWQRWVANRVVYINRLYTRMNVIDHHCIRYRIMFNLYAPRIARTFSV